MHQSLAQQSQTRVPDLVIPHREIYQGRLATENSADLPTATAGYATVLQAAGKEHSWSCCSWHAVLDTAQHPQFRTRRVYGLVPCWTLLDPSRLRYRYPRWGLNEATHRSCTPQGCRGLWLTHSRPLMQASVLPGCPFVFIVLFKMNFWLYHTVSTWLPTPFEAQGQDKMNHASPLNPLRGFNPDTRPMSWSKKGI